MAIKVLEIVNAGDTSAICKVTKRKKAVKSDIIKKVENVNTKRKMVSNYFEGEF